MTIPEKAAGVRIERALTAYVRDTLRLLIFPAEDSQTLPPDLTVEFSLEQGTDVLHETAREIETSASGRPWIHLTLTPDHDQPSAVLSCLQSGKDEQAALNAICRIRLLVAKKVKSVLEKRDNGAFSQDGCDAKHINVN